MDENKLWRKWIMMVMKAEIYSVQEKRLKMLMMMMVCGREVNCEDKKDIILDCEHRWWTSPQKLTYYQEFYNLGGGEQELGGNVDYLCIPLFSLLVDNCWPFVWLLISFSSYQSSFDYKALDKAFLFIWLCQPFIYFATDLKRSNKKMAC